MKEFFVKWITFFIICLFVMIIWNNVFVDVCNGYIREIQTGDFHDNIRKTNDRSAVSRKKVRLKQRKPRIFDNRGFCNTFCLIDMKSSF